MEATYSSEKSDLTTATRRHIPEDGNLQKCILPGSEAYSFSCIQLRQSYPGLPLNAEGNETTFRYTYIDVMFWLMRSDVPVPIRAGDGTKARTSQNKAKNQVVIRFVRDLYFHSFPEISTRPLVRYPDLSDNLISGHMDRTS
jgi:hypothetical protein